MYWKVERGMPGKVSDEEGKDVSSGNFIKKGKAIKTKWNITKTTKE